MFSIQHLDFETRLNTGQKINVPLLVKLKKFQNTKLKEPFPDYKSNKFWKAKKEGITEVKGLFLSHDERNENLLQNKEVPLWKWMVPLLQNLCDLLYGTLVLFCEF